MVGYAGHKREERLFIFDPCGAGHEGKRRRPHRQLCRLAPRQRPSRYKGYIPYYVSKAAVAALTESLALDLAPEILVNVIAPGPILAPPDLTPDENAKTIEATPLARWGGAEEIAKAVLFLVETDFVTGECIRVDGGRHLY